MPTRLLLALLILVAAPLVLLGWVSAAATASSQKRAEEQLQTLLRSRLIEIDRSTAKLFDGYAQDLTNELSGKGNVIENLKSLRRSNPIVRQGIFVSSDGQLLYPGQPIPEDTAAVALYAALPGMISGRANFVDSTYSSNQGITPQQQRGLPYAQTNAPARMSGPAKNSLPTGAKQSAKGGYVAQSKQAAPPQQALAAPSKTPLGKTPAGKAQQGNTNLNISSVTESSSGHQWQNWYFDQGMQLTLWLPRADGAAVGILLERPRWASDLTATLPDTNPVQTNESDAAALAGFTALVDESRQVVYRWGDEGECSEQPVASLPVSAPLSAWQWEHHSATPLIPKVSTLPIIASLISIGVVLLALGGYVLTGVQRQMRAAKSRVSFAGQVSHELRTPLTNIRLYAELAESDLEKLPDSDPRESIQKRLSVIDSESKRLSRLVSGVLEMIRDGNKQRGPRIAAANPNQLIKDTLSQFAPTFENLQFVIEEDLQTDQLVQMDADIFEMVLVNLLSNTEKYAADGRYAGVASRFDDRDLVVTVSDRGPGIASGDRKRVFRAFSRLDDSINAPSGTGIGLAIASSAAVRHGGNLRLINNDSENTGAIFELRIPVGRETFLRDQS